MEAVDDQMSIRIGSHGHYNALKSRNVRADSLCYIDCSRNSLLSYEQAFWPSAVIDAIKYSTF